MLFLKGRLVQGEVMQVKSLAKKTVGLYNDRRICTCNFKISLFSFNLCFNSLEDSAHVCADLEPEPTPTFYGDSGTNKGGHPIESIWQVSCPVKKYSSHKINNIVFRYF